jgi:CCR4-NOT transcription complex subunit 3
MEMFKAVEKEMKTKAYSKEGLSNTKLDPKEREKADMVMFLSTMVEELDRQVEQVEAESEALGATQKRGRKDTSKADRQAQLDETSERHKWHQTKLELIMRVIENGGMEVDSIKDIQEDIKYYVENNAEVDFIEDESIYDNLDLEEEEDQFGVGNENELGSSLDAQSNPDESRDLDSPIAKPPAIIQTKPKSVAASDAATSARRPSMQLKSPLPALATLHTVNPAPPPAVRPAEPLKYASAAAAAAASDKNGLGLPSLPPPPPTTVVPTNIPVRTASVVSSSPSYHSAELPSKAPVTTAVSPPPIEPPPEIKRPLPFEEEPKRPVDVDRLQEPELPPSTPSLTNGDTHSDADEEESIYHLPSMLADLLDTFESTKTTSFQPISNPASQQSFLSSVRSYPDNMDSERPQIYRPSNSFPYTPSYYPQQPLAIFEDPRLYTKVDTDTLFYAFYYKQGTYQQYASAKALKSQSWRFHKQYQTWFQRHEEPKDITEDYEQGTYRFFDYESTWLVQFASFPD